MQSTYERGHFSRNTKINYRLNCCKMPSVMSSINGLHFYGSNVGWHISNCYFPCFATRHSTSEFLPRSNESKSDRQGDDMGSCSCQRSCERSCHLYIFLITISWSLSVNSTHFWCLFTLTDVNIKLLILPTETRMISSSPHPLLLGIPHRDHHYSCYPSPIIGLLQPSQPISGNDML